MVGGYFKPIDRQLVADMWKACQPVAAIARALAVDPTTIYRELRLGNDAGAIDDNKRLEYDPELAQTRFHENLRRRGRKIKGGKS